jgi:hypothetical protein
MCVMGSTYLCLLYSIFPERKWVHRPHFIDKEGKIYFA